MQASFVNQPVSPFQTRYLEELPDLVVEEDIPFEVMNIKVINKPIGKRFLIIFEMYFRLHQMFKKSKMYM